jgi:hypothetical protein
MSYRPILGTSADVVFVNYRPLVLAIWVHRCAHLRILRTRTCSLLFSITLIADHELHSFEETISINYIFHCRKPIPKLLYVLGIAFVAAQGPLRACKIGILSRS